MARLAATPDRDRMVEAAKVCTKGPAMVAAAEKVVEAARVVMAVEWEVAQSAAPVEIGGWQIVGECKRKTVEVVLQLGPSVDSERRKSLQEAVTKVEGLVGVANMGWRVVGLPYMVHVGDEVLWTVQGVDVDMKGTEVMGVIFKNLEAVWGQGSVVGCWVENKQLAYVVVRSILERAWLSQKGGLQGLVDSDSGII